MLKVWYLLVRKLVKQAGHMVFQMPAVFQSLIAEYVKHLGICHCRDEVEGGVRIGDDTEKGGLSVP